MFGLEGVGASLSHVRHRAEPYYGLKFDSNGFPPIVNLKTEPGLSGCQNTEKPTPTTGVEDGKLVWWQSGSAI